MMITRETDYAIRILRSLMDGRRLSTTEISAQQEVPLQFAYKIIKKLEKAGLLSIARGSNGGCTLGKDLVAVSLYDLMEVMGERGDVSACMRPEFECSWRKGHGGCLVHDQMEKLQEKIENELKSVDLKSLIAGKA